MDSLDATFPAIELRGDLCGLSMYWRGRDCPLWMSAIWRRPLSNSLYLKIRGWPMAAVGTIPLKLL